MEDRASETTGRKVCKTEMNWRRGFFRIWIVAAAIWLIVVASAGYLMVIIPRQRAAAEQACFEQNKSGGAGNPFDCFSSQTPSFEDLIPLSKYAIEYALAAFGPILAVLLLGLLGGWIASGFRSPPR